MKNIFNDLCFALGFTIVAAVMLFSSHVSAGEYYGIVGGGATNFHKLPENGGWYQDGWDYQHEPRSNTFTIGIGKKINKWWDVELDYRDLGTFNGIVRHVDDAALYCKKSCPTTHTSFVRADSRGVGLSGVLHTTDDSTNLFLRAGVFVFGSKTEIVSVSGPENDKGRSLHRLSGDRSILATPFLGIGLALGPLAIEVNEFFKVGGQYAPMKRAETVTVSFRMGF